MINLKSLEIVKDKPHLNEILNGFLENLYECVNNFIADKQMFSIDDFNIHILDEYVLGTNSHSPIFINVYLEIDEPMNYRQDIKKSKKLNKDKVEIPNLYLKLSDIKNGLYKTFLSYFNSDNIFWISKYSIALKSTIYLDDNNSTEFYINIIPALTYYNKNNVRGLMYYEGNDIEIEYPEQFIENFENKNKETNDLYRKTILIFKNIILTAKEYSSVPFEIIETLLYNVPNQLFKSDDIQDILNIVNFIRNNPLKNFRTIDEQDFAFSSIYRSMSIFYVKRVLKIIETYLTKQKSK